jgi:hypothetical protein
MVSRRKLLDCNFRRLTIADESYWALIFVGQEANGSY